MKHNFESRISALEHRCTILPSEAELKKSLSMLYGNLYEITFSSWTDFEDYLIREYPDACRSDYTSVKIDNNSNSETELQSLLRDFAHDTAKCRGIIV